jgi:hypothetical protein
MSLDGKIFSCRFRSGIPRPLTANVAGEGGFLHPAMDPGLFEGFEGRCLGMREAGFDAAFGKNPASLAGLDQQEFDLTATYPVTHRSDLFAFPKFPQFRQPNKLSR